MTHRLSAFDASFLYVEQPRLPMHVGSLVVFAPGDGGHDHDEVVRLIAERIAGHARYRQRVRSVPGRLANPVWVDDPLFDLDYHVRRAALPAPGGREQLEEFVARVSSRMLDRDRPLWEVYVIEGLADGRFAVLTKAHQALVDGVHAVDIAHLLIDPDAAESIVEFGGDGHDPSDLRLVGDALLDSVRRPSLAIDALRGGVRDVHETGRRVLGVAGQVAATLAQVSTRTSPVGPLSTTVGRARRWVTVDTDLADYRAVRQRLTRGRYVEDVTINDVVLATITGALRTWLQTRGEPVTSAYSVRTMVPVSVYDERGEHRRGAQMRACFVDLPVGESNPSMRLHQISFAMRQQMESTRGVDALSLSTVGGFAPPTLHSLGARVGSAMTSRLFSLVVTNVPGPQQPLRALGSRVEETYPVMPLGRDQALSIGLTSYDGHVYYGLNADRDAVADLDVLAHALPDALAELREAHRGSRR